MEIVQYLFTVPGVKCFLSGWLSQDCLEKFFGCQCQRGKSSKNPNEYEFCKNSQALRVINSVCRHVRKGNCRGRKDSIDWEAESKPLSKCKKQRCENQSPLLKECSLAKSWPLASSTLLAVKSQCQSSPMCPVTVVKSQCQSSPMCPVMVVKSQCQDSEIVVTINKYSLKRSDLSTLRDNN